MRTTKAKEAVKVSLYLDTRRKKDNGLFPVKIRVYDSSLKKARLYTTDFELTEKDFDRIFHPEKGQRFRKEETEIKDDLNDLKFFYQEKIQAIKAFTFEALENSLSIRTGEQNNAFYHYECVIMDLKEQDRFGTASSYELSMKSLKRFLTKKRGKEPKQLLFQEITVKFLNDYEAWMINEKEKSPSTVGIYLRGLKVVFNKAIDQNAIDKELYPFGIKKYQIPASKNTKKAFNSKQLETLFKAVPKTDHQKKAKDFWFFSFVCNGMNIKDILYLKWKNIEENQIIFVREKSRRTKKANSKPIQVPLIGFARTFIEKFDNPEKKKNDFVFPILKSHMTEQEKFRVKNNFIKFLNQHMKQLAENNGLIGNASTYWARHSFSTSAIRKKASIEYVSEALGHSDLKTTKNYFAGFEDETKKEILEDITDFMR
ncbi:tyrosine-type recombinase/integrase [Cyclobacterium sp. SYSU L10401]|uniref:tyrosine-type recombinase/integrase n=1 Tax=Cyclobacterium sp. SYSU L10401 TaxID=2678657 RepID=UPI0013D7F0E2|nr:site-specific integrase [Cyclobacterium sp. SYSU L10401]